MSLSAKYNQEILPVAKKEANNVSISVPICETDTPIKAANINFAQVMAKDLAACGIRVNTVCPGMVKTPLNRSVWHSWNERQPAAEQLTYDQWAEQKISQLVPLGEWQQPEDIADTIVFLSSERARQITGQTINVDGGYVMHW